MTTFRDLHVQAQAVISGLDGALLVAPVVGVMVSNHKHVNRLQSIRRDAQRLLELTTKNGTFEQESSGVDREDLLEAVRAQDATCTLHLFAAKRSRFDGKPDEEHLDYPVPPGVSLCRGLVFLVPAAPPAADKRRAIVVEVLADGRGAVARVKIEDRFSRAVPTEAPN